MLYALCSIFPLIPPFQYFLRFASGLPYNSVDFGNSHTRELKLEGVITQSVTPLLILFCVAL